MQTDTKDNEKIGRFERPKIFNNRINTSIKKVVGFVVNICNSYNYDIDLYLSKEQKEKYWNAITNNYKYIDDISQEITDEKITDKKISDENTNKYKEGISYRCRLEGIGMTDYKDFYSNKNGYDKKYSVNDINKEMSMLINRSGGWVIVDIIDIDIYNRLLVNIKDPITQMSLNNIHFNEKYKHIFYRYNKITR